MLKHLKKKENDLFQAKSIFLPSKIYKP